MTFTENKQDSLMRSADKGVERSENTLNTFESIAEERSAQLGTRNDNEQAQVKKSKASLSSRLSKPLRRSRKSSTVSEKSVKKLDDIPDELFEKHGLDKEEMKKLNINIDNLAAFWDEFTLKTRKKQEINPFSARFNGKKEVPEDHIIETKSEERVNEAQIWMNKELSKLIEVINKHGIYCKETDSTSISFGELFVIYETISNTLVFMLIKARKKGKLYFDENKESLYQGRDDEIMISLNH